MNRLSGGSRLDKGRIQNLFTSTAKHARDHFRCRDVVDSVLQVLNDRTYIEYHNTYLAILGTYVLESRKQRIAVLPEHWPALLTVCVKVYQNATPDMNRSRILEVLQLIVHHGCSQSRLLFKTKTLLPVISMSLTKSDIKISPGR